MADIERSKAVDMEKALSDPESVFASPEALLHHEGLSKQQKIEILRRWEYDASEASVAAEEGMPGGNGDLMQRILLAIEQLSSGIDMEQLGPTKQHGIPSSAIKSK